MTLRLMRSSRPRHFDVEAAAVDPEVPQAQPFQTNHAVEVLQLELQRQRSDTRLHSARPP